MQVHNTARCCRCVLLRPCSPSSHSKRPLSRCTHSPRSFDRLRGPVEELEFNPSESSVPSWSNSKSTFTIAAICLFTSSLMSRVESGCVLNLRRLSTRRCPMTERKGYVILQCSHQKWRCVCEMRVAGLLTMSEESFADPFQMYYQPATSHGASRNPLPGYKPSWLAYSRVKNK